MKTLIGALALIIAAPVAAQTATPPVAPSATGQMDHSKMDHGQHMQGKHDCKECCEKMKGKDGKMECMDKKADAKPASSADADGGHEGHAH